MGYDEFVWLMIGSLMSSPCHANIYVKQQHLSTWAHALRDGRIMGRDWTYLPPWPTSCPPSPGPGQGTAHAHLPLRDPVIESSKHDVYFVSASERQRQWDWRRRSLEDKKKTERKRSTNLIIWRFPLSLLIFLQTVSQNTGRVVEYFHWNRDYLQPITSWVLS